MLLRQPTEKAGDFSNLCRPLTTAEVTAYIYHYTDMCPVAAQKTQLIDFIHFATEELTSNNSILLPTLGHKQANKLGNSLLACSINLLLRDFWCCPCPLPKVSVMKNPRDAETHSGKYQSGSKESVSTFPKVCRYTHHPQLQRPQHSMQKAWRRLVPAFLALPNVTSTAPQARESLTSNQQPSQAASWLGRTHPNPASYFLSPSWGGSFGSLHVQLCFCPAVQNMPL